MYKIYVNSTPLLLLDEKEVENWPEKGEDVLLARYPGKAKFLLQYVDMLEKTDRYRAVALYSQDFEQLRRDFDEHFVLIEAAGGVVFNSSNEVLLIFRRGSWDLPKGKIDEGESPEEAAVREVQEETGLQELELGALIDLSYHTYRDPRHGRVLKRTYWYRMQTGESKLVPQTEEDIEQATWMRLSDFWASRPTVYGNIRDLLKKIEGES